MPMLSVLVMRAVVVSLRGRKLLVRSLAAALHTLDHFDELPRIAAAQRRSDNRREAEIRDESDTQHCETKTLKELAI